MSLWREMTILALATLLGLSTAAYLSERDARVGLQTEYDMKLAQAEVARSNLLARSEETLKKIEQDHRVNLKKVKDHAYANFVARYGGCIGRVPLSAVPGLGAARPTDRAEPPDAAAEEPVAAFARDCASDAAALSEFQVWVRSNRLPVAGE